MIHSTKFSPVGNHGALISPKTRLSQLELVVIIAGRAWPCGRTLEFSNRHPWGASFTTSIFKNTNPRSAASSSLKSRRTPHGTQPRRCQRWGPRCDLVSRPRFTRNYRLWRLGLPESLTGNPTPRFRRKLVSNGSQPCETHRLKFGCFHCTLDRAEVGCSWQKRQTCVINERSHRDHG